jgi:hypothetical protein
MERVSKILNRTLKGLQREWESVNELRKMLFHYELKKDPDYLPPDFAKQEKEGGEKDNHSGG